MSNTPQDPSERDRPDRDAESSSNAGEEQAQPGFWEQAQSGQQEGQYPPGQYGQGQYGQYGQGQYGQAQYGQYGDPYGAGSTPVQYAPDHPRSTTVLVLGILGIVVCGVIAPFAWVMGRKTLQEIDASHGTLGGRGPANAGYILGIIGSILLGLGLLVFVLFAALAVLGIATSTTTTY